MLIAVTTEFAAAGGPSPVLEWVQMFAPGALLGVMLGFYLAGRGRRTAFNEQHVRVRVEAARENFLAAHLAAYRIANRLALDEGQGLADVWTQERVRQIDDLVDQLYDHEFMLNGRQARPVGAIFGEARRMIHEITQAAEKPDRTPAAERTQRHQLALIELFRHLQHAESRWYDWEDAQWDLVRTRLARRVRAWRRHRVRSSG